MIYKWKTSAHEGGDPQGVGEELYRIKEECGGGLTPGGVVKAAKKKDSILNRYFEWSDSAAAQKYREGQARHLIANVCVLIETPDETKVTRAFVSIKTEDSNIFVDAGTAMSDDQMREQVLMHALDEFQVLERKYRDLLELQNIFTEVVKARSRLMAGAKPHPKPRQRNENRIHMATEQTSTSHLRPVRQGIPGDRGTHLSLYE